MIAINRLLEINKIARYSKYLSQKLIPAVNERLNLQLKQDLYFAKDPYILTYRTTLDASGDMMDIALTFTTNSSKNEGICWASFIIAGRKVEVGSLTGDLSYDVDIIEDSYYFFFDEMERRGIKPVGVNK